MNPRIGIAAWVLSSSLAKTGWVNASDMPDPRTKPDSPVMLVDPSLPADRGQIDFAKLPRVRSQRSIVSDVRTPGADPHVVNKQSGGVNQHNYLTHFDGKFWIMWSDGPGVEDKVGQRVRFATSGDGLRWSKPEWLTPPPPNSGTDSPHYGTRTLAGLRWIARGFWQRNGELLALASLDEAAGFFGPGLELRGFRLVDGQWRDIGLIYKNAINNFPPEQLPDGRWMMSRRTHDYKKTGVHFLVGGVSAFDHWESFPVLGSNDGLVAEEPHWWTLPDGNLMALFRDNRRGGYLFRSFSTDNGKTWTKPARTDFPDATSKLFGLRLNNGCYVLVSNANPRRRDPLTIAIGADGMTFRKLAYLAGGRHIDYPHAIQHGDDLFVAFSGGKQTVEVLRIAIADLPKP